MNILIIGVTSGIGKTLYETYVLEDNLIGIVGRRTNLLEELHSKHPSKTFVATADITNQENARQAICLLQQELGEIDLAIVCSGTGDINPSLDYAIERPAIDLNVMGCTFS